MFPEIGLRAITAFLNTHAGRFAEASVEGVRRASDVGRAGLQMLQALSRIPAASPVRPTAIASERLVADPAQQPGGFANHPAVLDAATHTAALFATADTADAAPVMRVPAALDAFQSGSRTRTQRRFGWCVGSLKAVQPSGMVITAFGLAPDAGSATAGTALHGFQAKVMGASPAAAAAAAEPPLNYCIQWQAQQTAGHDSFEGPAGARQSRGVHWVRADSEAPIPRIYRMPAAKGVARPAHDAAHSLALLQTVVRDAAPGTGLQLITRGALSFPDVCDTPGAVHSTPFSRAMLLCACCLLSFASSASP